MTIENSNDFWETPLSLEDLRAEIDAIDDEILGLLAKRFSLTDEVGVYKAKNALAPEDSVREAKQYKRMKRLAKDLDLPLNIERELWAVIMGAAKERHAGMQS